MAKKIVKPIKNAMPTKAMLDFAPIGNMATKNDIAKAMMYGGSIASKKFAPKPIAKGKKKGKSILNLGCKNAPT